MSLRAVVARLSVLAVLIVTAAGCAPAAISLGPPSIAAATPAASSGAPAGPTMPPVPGGARPPGALLEAGRPGATMPGDPGTFSWAGLVSDAPWIVSHEAIGAGSGRPLTVSFTPPVTPAAWEARWAPVTGGQPGDPFGAGSGASVPIAITTPPAAGSWSLQLRVQFGPGREATWYWRVEVAP